METLEKTVVLMEKELVDNSKKIDELVTLIYGSVTNSGVLSDIREIKSLLSANQQLMMDFIAECKCKEEKKYNAVKWVIGSIVSVGIAIVGWFINKGD